jgi:FkbM family methyltransferase
MAQDVAQLQVEELALLQWLSEMVEPRVLVDVGAHQGRMCEPFLTAGWQVFAFEPFEANVAVLRQRLGHYQQLVVRCEAVSDSSGMRTLHVAVRPDGHWHEYYHSLEEVGETAEYRYQQAQTVRTVSLDDLVAQGELPRCVGVLKVDTEGHDWAVLRGAARVEATVVSVEFWCEGLYGGRCPSPATQMVRLMQQRGYPYYLVIAHQDSRVWRQWSSLDGLGPQTWGNLFFFRDAALAAAVQRRFDQQTPPASAVPAQPPRWIQLLRPLLPQDQPWLFYDVGAYHGDFTATILEHFPTAQGLAFEPTPHTFRFLQQRFATHPRVQLQPLALSDQEGRAQYYLLEQSYNNSLLPPCDVANCQTLEVAVTTLDHIRKQHAQPVRWIKIDAQGHDLHILRGAQQILQQDRPILWVEANFVPMYAQQDDPCELWTFLLQCGYRLAGWYNTHCTSTGLVAYTDYLFLPAELHQQLLPATRLERYICDDPHTLQQQNHILQQACQERLELIQRLEKECALREQIIAALRQPSLGSVVRQLSKWGLQRLGRPGTWLLQMLSARRQRSHL